MASRPARRPTGAGERTQACVPVRSRQTVSCSSSSTPTPWRAGLTVPVYRTPDPAGARAGRCGRRRRAHGAPQRRAPLERFVVTPAAGSARLAGRDSTCLNPDGAPARLSGGAVWGDAQTSLRTTRCVTGDGPCRSSTGREIARRPPLPHRHRARSPPESSRLRKQHCPEVGSPARPLRDGPGRGRASGAGPCQPETPDRDL